MDSKEKQKRILYLFLLAGLIIMYATYIPYLMDYYIVRPEGSFVSGFCGSEDILNAHYEFEQIFIMTGVVILYLLTSNCGVSITITSFLLFLLTHASYIKYLNRKELLRLDDLRLTEAAGMAMEYLHFSYSRYLVTLIIGITFFIFLSFGMEYWRKHWKKKRGYGQFCLQALVALLLCGGLFGYTSFYFQGMLSINKVDKYDLLDPEANKYVLYRFLENDSYATLGMDDVEESYRDLLAQSEERTVMNSKEKPTIIVIMNESWWDTDNVDANRVSFSRDPMEPYKALAEKCITGHLTTNVYGGGTVSSEAEFLIGVNTKHFVGSSTIYAETLGRKMPTIVDYLEAQGYSTTAIHPYYREFYDRDKVYETMGFDKKIFQDDMYYTEIYSKYISDESLANQIIAEYDENQRQFIWAVSMANHKRILEYGSGSIENYDYPISVTLAENPNNQTDYDDLVNYVNGIYLANRAFEQLVDYFEQVDRPIVLVMFGDHIPNFSEETLGIIGLDPEDSSREMLERLYSVPVIVWSNCSDGEISFSGEAIYYLSSMLFEYAGLPDSDMMRIRRLERTEFQANTRSIVTDGEGNLLERCSEKQMHILNQIRSIEFDILFGNGFCKNIWKP